MAKVRNPLTGFALTILVSAALGGLVLWPASFIPYFEFRVFALGFALLAIGALAGRNAYMGLLGFVGAFLGGFLGFYVGEAFFWINTYEFVLAMLMGVPAGVGGLVTGRLAVRRMEKAKIATPSLRRCKRCGSRVGLSAVKCWSCKATLTF